MSTDTEELRAENVERIKDLARQGVGVMPWIPLEKKVDLLIERIYGARDELDVFEYLYESALSEVLDQAEREALEQQLQVKENSPLILPGMGG